MRDPRHDPAPGDVLLVGTGRDRHRLQVLECDGLEVRYRRTDAYRSWVVSTILASWRIHMAGAEVVTAANSPTPEV